MKKYFHAGRNLIEGLQASMAAKPRTEELHRQRLTIVQFGDYEEGFLRLHNGGIENYYGQRYSVDAVGALAGRKDIESVTVVCASADAAPRVLPNGIRTVGLRLYPPGQPARHRELIELVRSTGPTHLIVATPAIPLLAWGCRRGIPMLPMFADSFQSKGLKTWIRNRQLALILNSAAVELVSNHNLAASRDLTRLGVAADKVVPFDWPALMSPDDYSAKDAPAGDDPFRVLYVGAINESKGIGDLIRAIARLARAGRAARLTVIGKGDVEPFRQLATAEGVHDIVDFRGLRSHEEAVAAMREHDAVVVPSRHDYPEGLPMTIYEALCTRTPLITSNHPMFALKIRDRQNALVFPQQDAAALANCITELASSPALYRQLSEASAGAAHGYLCPLKYHQLIEDFLEPEKRQQLRKFSLQSALVPGRLPGAALGARSSLPAATVSQPS